MKRSEQLRFWSKVRIGWPDECWLWQACTRNGYGAFGAGGRVVPASRYALLGAHGMMDDPLHVLHSCDVPACCNPRHLRLGTRADNMADRDRRGRTQKGTACYNAKLTDDDVREIRRLLAGGVSNTEIAAAYGVVQTAISQIKTGKRWGWLA